MKLGTLIGERYEIEWLAGRGGMGDVYRARDRASGEPVALKLLHQESEPRDDRFVREVRALAGLSHPAIVGYVAHGVTLVSNRTWNHRTSDDGLMYRSRKPR